ncbi:MAG TPA: choice-of-anchor Q domain-containing protein, partial [Rhodothermales bacterium]|nr:choice-of-anchor Q domain-containing protein [Rhodothermales bacterium]
QVNTGAALTLHNVTVAGNATTAGGSGVWVFGGTLTAVNTTIAANSNDGLFVDWATSSSESTVTLTNVILADNGSLDWRNPSSGAVSITRSLAEQRNGAGTFPLTSDPALGPLADNGGPVWTMAIASMSSPVFDAGDAGACLVTDARGTARFDVPGVANNGASTCDLGAYEHGTPDNFAPTITAIPNQIYDGANPNVVTFTVSDFETAAGALTLSATSTNTSVLPVANVVFGGTGAARTATLTPTAGSAGSTTVTITVADERGATATASFTFEYPTLGPIRWSGGEADFYFPTGTGRFSFGLSNDLAHGDGIYFLDVAIVARGFWPGQSGFTYGVAGYPLHDPSFHDLGGTAGADEWGFRGQNGRTLHGGASQSWGRIINQIGDRVRIWYDSRTDELSFYSKRAAESAWTLEGGGVAFTNVVPAAGRVFRFAVAGVCFSTCGVRIVGSQVPPKAADAIVTLTEHTSYAFAAADFRFDNQGDGDVLDHVQVVSLPATGALFLDANGNTTLEAGEAVAAGTDVPNADLASGRLRYLPGDPVTATFTFTVHDGLSSSSAYTMTLDAGALPVELTSFTATADGPDVVLRWETASETNNAGFAVEAQAVAENAPASASPSWRAMGFVEGRGTTSEVQAYTHRISGLTPGPYRFRLRQVDLDGAVAYGPAVEVSAGMSGAAMVEVGGATVRFAVREPQAVQAELFNALGQRIATLYDGEASAGQTTVLGMPGGLSAGVYFVRVMGRSFRETVAIVVR